jgi:uncharacterized protein involved in outer membrane biogenesis
MRAPITFFARECSAISCCAATERGNSTAVQDFTNWTLGFVTVDWQNVRTRVASTRSQLHSGWTRWRARSAARYARWRQARRQRGPLSLPLAALKWGGAVLAAAIILLLIFFDWNMLRGPLARYASHRLHRQVQIAGNLHVHIWSWTPRIDVSGVRIANTAWAGGGAMAQVGHLTMTVRLMPLLAGHTILPLVDVERASFLVVRDKDGLSNWTFDNAAAKRPFKLPPIHHFVIRDGKVEIIDARRNLRFSGQVSSNESTAGNGRGFWLTGTGTLNREPFEADVHGAPLLNVDESRPYPFTADVRAGATRMTADGVIDHPFDFGAMEAAVTFSGPDAADVYYLTGIVFPNTPPYRLNARIVRDGEIYRFANVVGRFGHSDASGAFTVDASGERLFVHGDLASRKVYFDDLGFLFGGGKGRNTAPPAPAATRRAVAAKPSITLAASSATMQTRLLLPDAPLDVERVRQMDADFGYTAKAIVSRDFPLHSIAMRVHLDHGVLRLESMKATLAQGTVAGHVKLDASRNVPITSVDLKLRDLRLEQLIHPANGSRPIEGAVDARAILSGAGNSVHKAAANANGTLTFVVPHGQMRKALAELMGINLLNGGLALLLGDKSETNLRCAVAHFEVHDGLLQARNILLDTDVERATGQGTVSLKNETVDLKFTGEAKSLRLLRMNAPITVTGSLSNPKVGVQASKALGQGGLVAALATLVAPLAGILPTIDPGLAKDANCGALLAEAKAKGAPVRRQAALNRSTEERLARH